MNQPPAANQPSPNTPQRGLRPQRPNNEKLIFIVLCVILILSISLALYISSSATHTLSSF